jgi:hypothetical protein
MGLTSQQEILKVGKIDQHLESEVKDFSNYEHNWNQWNDLEDDRSEEQRRQIDVPRPGPSDFSSVLCVDFLRQAMAC